MAAPTCVHDRVILRRADPLKSALSASSHLFRVYPGFDSSDRVRVVLRIPFNTAGGWSVLARLSCQFSFGCSAVSRDLRTMLRMLIVFCGCLGACFNLVHSVSMVAAFSSCPFGHCFHSLGRMQCTIPRSSQLAFLLHHSFHDKTRRYLGMWSLSDIYHLGWLCMNDQCPDGLSGAVMARSEPSCRRGCIKCYFCPRGEPHGVKTCVITYVMPYVIKYTMSRPAS